MNSGIPVKMFREKYHQCGRRSSASVSPSWMRSLGYGMGKEYGSARRKRAARRRLRS